MSLGLLADSAIRLCRSYESHENHLMKLQKIVVCVHFLAKWRHLLRLGLLETNGRRAAADCCVVNLKQFEPINEHF